MNSYNNYSQLLLVPDDFMNYLYLLKCIFHQQWEFLAAARGIYSRDADNGTTKARRYRFLKRSQKMKLTYYLELKKSQ